MATRTAYDATLGSVLTAANLDRHAGGWIGHNEVTADQGPITSAVDGTGLSLTVTVNTARKIRVSGRAGFTSTVNTDVAALFITDGANVVQQEGYALMAMATAASHFVEVSRVLNASAGSNTWKLRLQRSGSGTMTMTASSTKPAFILIEDIGPSS